MSKSSGLNNISTRSLISLTNKLYDTEPLTLEEFEGVDEEELRESLIDDIKTKLTELGYNGKEFFVPIFMFARNYAVILSLFKLALKLDATETSIGCITCVQCEGSVSK